MQSAQTRCERKGSLENVERAADEAVIDFPRARRESRTKSYATGLVD